MIKILVVDDEQMICNLLETFLDECRYQCDSVNSGEEALSRLCKRKYHVVLLDILLKGKISGIEVLREIWQHHGNVAVILITGINSPDLAIAVKGYDALDYIVKPFDLNEIDSSIRRSLLAKFGSASLS